MSAVCDAAAKDRKANEALTAKNVLICMTSSPNFCAQSRSCVSSEILPMNSGTAWTMADGKGAAL
jgi:hypothetical protein